MQVDEILIVLGEFLRGDGVEGAIEIVDAIEEILGEALQGEFAGGGDFALGLFLEVAVFGDLPF